MSTQECPICYTTINENEQQYLCPHCQMAYHLECWQENKGCATYGCQANGCLKTSEDKVVISFNDDDKSSIKGSILCPHCKNKISKDDLFCWSCGQQILSSNTTKNCQTEASDVLISYILGSKYRFYSKFNWGSFLVVFILSLIGIGGMSWVYSIFLNKSNYFLFSLVIIFAFTYFIGTMGHLVLAFAKTRNKLFAFFSTLFLSLFALFNIWSSYIEQKSGGCSFNFDDYCYCFNNIGNYGIVVWNHIKIYGSLAYIVIVLEALIIVLGAVGLTLYFINKSVCENCGSPVKTTFISPPIEFITNISAIEENISSGSVNLLLSKHQVSAGVNHSILKIESCHCSKLHLLTITSYIWQHKDSIQVKLPTTVLSKIILSSKLVNQLKDRFGNQILL